MPEPLPPSASSSSSPENGARSSRILVIDDDEFIRALIRRGLENTGYTVAEATNGFEAMTQFRQFKPDGVITDLLMPERDGIETILEIRRLAPHVPIMAISGGYSNMAPVYLKTAGELGADVMLSKPFSVAQLLSALAPLVKPKQG